MCEPGISQSGAHKIVSLAGLWSRGGTSFHTFHSTPASRPLPLCASAERASVRRAAAPPVAGQEGGVIEGRGGEGGEGKGLSTPCSRSTSC